MGVVQTSIECGSGASSRSVPIYAAALAVCLAGALAAPAWGAGELRFLIEGEAGIRSDGNYLQSELAEGVETDDESLARGGLHLRLSYDLPRLDLALAYSPAYEQTLGESEISGTSHRLNLGVEAELTRRLSMSIRERLLKSPNLDLYAPVQAPEPIAVTRRGDQLSHAFDVSFAHDLTRRTSLTIGASHTLRTFEEAGLFDTETFGGRLGAEFALTEERQMGATAGWGQFDYETRGEADVQTLGVTYAQTWGRDGRLAVEAGVFSVDSIRRRAVVSLPADATGPLPNADEIVREETSTGWRGGFDVSRQARLFGWSVGYRHDVSAGAGLGRAAEADSAFAGVSTAIGRRLTLGLDGNASRHSALEEDDPVPATTPETGSDDDLLNEFVAGTARFGWTLFQGLRLTGGYSRIWQRSRVEPFENLSYDRYFLGLAFRIWSTGETPEEPDLPAGATDEARSDEKPDPR